MHGVCHRGLYHITGGSSSGSNGGKNLAQRGQEAMSITSDVHRVGSNEMELRQDWHIRFFVSFGC
jgi:hypothetical protein